MKLFYMHHTMRMIKATVRSWVCDLKPSAMAIRWRPLVWAPPGASFAIIVQLKSSMDKWVHPFNCGIGNGSVISSHTLHVITYPSILVKGNPVAYGPRVAGVWHYAWWPYRKSPRFSLNSLATQPHSSLADATRTWQLDRFHLYGYMSCDSDQIAG